MRFITVFLRFIQSNSVYLCCLTSLQNILYAHSNRNTTSANILSLFKRKSRHRTVVLKKHPLRTPAVALKIINGNNIVDPCTFPLITSQDKVLSKSTGKLTPWKKMHQCGDAEFINVSLIGLHEAMHHSMLLMFGQHAVHQNIYLTLSIYDRSLAAPPA